mgnify:CR=1 FL=1
MDLDPVAGAAEAGAALPPQSADLRGTGGGEEFNAPDAIFAWLSPDRTAHSYDGMTRRSGPEKLGTWRATAVAGAHFIVISGPAARWTARIDWPPPEREDDGMVILARRDGARKRSRPTPANP